jgi:hypothetical protein
MEEGEMGVVQEIKDNRGQVIFSVPPPGVKAVEISHYSG